MMSAAATNSPPSDSTLPQIGSRDRFRGILKLVIEPTALDVVEARVEGLDWRRVHEVQRTATPVAAS